MSWIIDMSKKLLTTFMLCLLIACSGSVPSSGQSSVTFPAYFPGYFSALPAATNASGDVAILLEGSTVVRSPSNFILGSANTWTAPQTFAGLRVAVRSTSAATVTASATTDYFLCLDPTSNAITVNLPSSPTTGQTFLIKDCTGQAAAHNITISPASGNIDGASNQILTIPFQSSAVTYTGTQWSLN